MDRFFKDVRTVERMNQGPLGRYIRLYADQLHAQGFRRPSARRKLQLAADFCRWFHGKRIAATQLMARHVGHYFQSRKRAGFGVQLGDRPAVVGLLKLLREQRVIKHHPHLPPLTPGQKVLREYDLYLQKERSLSPATRTGYAPFVRQFLASRFGRGRAELSTLKAPEVLKFVQRHAAQLKNKRALLMTTALRSFLRFARYRGDITLDLAACVPSVASWSLSTIPKALPPAQVDQVLAHARERATAVGRRDYASGIDAGQFKTPRHARFRSTVTIRRSAEPSSGTIRTGYGSSIRCYRADGDPSTPPSRLQRSSPNFL